MSIEKTLEILDLFSFSSKVLTVQEIADKLGLPASSVYRYVRVLKNKGYLTENEGGLYKLGYRFIEMANIVRSDNTLSTIALPIMKEITEKTGETSILTKIFGYHAVCIETVPANHTIRVSAEQGSILPLYAGASSKTLLAHKSTEFVNKLFQNSYVKQLTPNTMTDQKSLEENLKEIREKGYSVSDQEIDNMVLAYGVPIKDANDTVVAALSLAGPKVRILEKNQSFFISTLNEAAQKIQKYL